MLIGLTLVSCLEEIDFVTENESFESALVIEATITNELKQQEIILSRSYKFEADGPSPESGASVIIESNLGTFEFEEEAPGKYISISSFAAQQNVDYTIRINTNNGRSYVSTPVQLTQESSIDNLYAVRENNDSGTNGMSIYIDSYDPSGNSKYYRYEYEETYKIIAPRWTDKEIILTDPLTCEVDLRDRIQEERVCYNTVISLTINLFNTSQLAEDRVFRHLIRFVDSENYILTYRYSIKVKQYIQSLEAYTFYKTLKEFSEEGSLFSQTQPGFISGNIVSESNPTEKVIGYFDVSTVSERRIFFDYSDFYLGEPIPLYPSLCNPRVLDQYTIGGGCGTLISGLLLDQVAYYSGASKIPDTIFSEEGDIIRIDTITVGPYNMVSRLCGDCTALGSNEVPEFWVD
jgi:hypothetical protein